MKILKLFTFFVILLAIIGGFIFWQRNKEVNNSQGTEKKEYRVSTGKVIVLRAQDKKEIAAIDLSAKEGDFVIEFTPHDVTMADDKTSLWITASASQEQIQAISKELVEKTKWDQHVMMATDQVISINPVTDKIIKRIPIGVSLDLADLILTPDGKSVFVAVERGNAIYRIDTSTSKVHLIQMPTESKPHQLALSVDGSKLYTRNQTNGNVFLISTKTNEVKNQDNTEEIKGLRWSGH